MIKENNEKEITEALHDNSLQFTSFRISLNSISQHTKEGEKCKTDFENSASTFNISLVFLKAMKIYYFIYLTIILRNRAEYHLILSRRGRRPSLAKSGDIPQD